jgi:hypothetical protein
MMNLQYAPALQKRFGTMARIQNYAIILAVGAVTIIRIGKSTE